MLYLSKSKYCRLWQCPKMLWLDTYRPELKEVTPADDARFAAGDEVGDLAKGVFGAYVDVTVKTADGEPDLPAMIERTKTEIDKGTPVICKASFRFEELYCTVDILKKEPDGWAICEVGPSRSRESNLSFHFSYKEHVYLPTLAYQKYVLEKCGVSVTAAKLVLIDSLRYTFDGMIAPNGLFCVSDVSKDLSAAEKKVAGGLQTAKETLASETEPDCDLSERCMIPCECDYWAYCTRNLPKPSVFDLYGLYLERALAYYHNGVTSPDALMRAGKLKDAPTILLEDKYNLRCFFFGSRFPLYFLDFMFIQFPVPRCVGTKPYQKIPFQYSLHYIERKGGELQHKEFLAESGADPRRAFAEHLCADVPKNARIATYDRSELDDCFIVLIDAFPDLREHLKNIRGNLISLSTMFEGSHFREYGYDQLHRFFEKRTIYALLAQNSEPDFQMPEAVHDESEAAELFLRCAHMQPQEKEEARRALLRFGELDTLIMAKAWDKLYRTVFY